MQLQPDRLFNRATPVPVKPPESTFEFEKEKLEKLAKKMGGQNLYKQLGVSEQASSEEITKAYYALAKEVNPVYKPKELQEISSEILRLYVEAKNTLCDTAKRKAYDNILHPMKTQPRDFRRMNATPPPNPRRPHFDPQGRKRF